MNHAALIEPLMTYSKDKLGLITNEKQENIEVIYNIICDNAEALHSSKYIIQQAALKYFKSEEFAKHCSYAGISRKLMMHIVENSPKQVYRNASS